MWANAKLGSAGLLTSVSSKAVGDARGRPVSWGNSVVVGSGPEPAVDIDGREVWGVTALVLEIAFSATCVDGGDVI